MVNADTHRRIFVLQAEICRGLAHPVRLEIVHLLGSEEMSFGDLLKRMGVSKTKLSQHLAVLRRARIVTARRDAARAVYQLTHPQIETACQAVTQALTQHHAWLPHDPNVLLRPT